MIDFKNQKWGFIVYLCIFFTLITILLLHKKRIVKLSEFYSDRSRLTFDMRPNFVMPTGINLMLKQRPSAHACLYQLLLNLNRSTI